VLLLNVPYSEKDEAKALGARWNPEKKKWYVPDGVDSTQFSRWTEAWKAADSTQKIQEIRSLFIDLVPKTAWFSNLRSELTVDEWEKVKKATFTAANYLCEVCGGRGPKHPVECHERWLYDSKDKVQTLTRTVALCPACHESTHFGLARVKGRAHEAKQHLMQVNGWNDAQAMQHIQGAMDEWVSRSKIQWKLDARWLLSFVQVSDTSKKKILDHAEGLEDRKIQDWQKNIINDQA
jgi:hypothetical protein